MIAQMDAVATRALTYLRSEPVRALDPRTVDRLADAVGRRRDARAHIRPSRHGGIVCFSPADGTRRVLELDRAGTVTAVLYWRPDGELDRARLRTAHGDWIGLEAQTAHHELRGCSDRLYRLRDGPSWQPVDLLAAFEAIRWSAISHVPPLADPTGLPPGAGTAVLNLIAALAGDQGTGRLRYRGPYPTEQLFTALLESFRFETDSRDPLEQFMGGGLDWSAAPHERVFERDGLCVQLRDGVEKAVFGRRAYYQTCWQSVIRNETRRVHRNGDIVVGAVWALGQPVEEHFVLDRSGKLLARRSTVPDPRPVARIGPRVHDGVTAVLRATSTPALDAAIVAAMRSLRLEWAGLAGDLVEVGGSRAHLSWRLADAGAARVRSGRSADDRLGRALEVLVEMARLLAGPLRLRAQSSLAARPLGEQRTALSQAAHPAPLASDIAGGAHALAEELERGPTASARHHLTSADSPP